MNMIPLLVLCIFGFDKFFLGPISSLISFVYLFFGHGAFNVVSIIWQKRAWKTKNKSYLQKMIYLMIVLNICVLAGVQWYYLSGLYEEVAGIAGIVPWHFIYHWY